MMDWSKRRIEGIAQCNHAQTYLEIGVNAGMTFLNVDVERKDGVDPAFLFDVKQHVTEKVRLFSQTSDAFWVSGEARIYDIIFIDGLHSFEQTMRDVISSMRFSHDRTVWLVDDTVPCDVFSAIPDQQASLRERQRLNLQGDPWHGDVFKVVMAIHDFFPTMSFATIINSGNPQTLMWYERRSDFKPRFNSWETISRMTYFDIERNFFCFNAVDERGALDKLRSSFLAYKDTAEWPRPR